MCDVIAGGGAGREVPMMDSRAEVAAHRCVSFPSDPFPQCWAGVGQGSGEGVQDRRYVSATRAYLHSIHQGMSISRPLAWPVYSLHEAKTKP